ncbi:sensor histidine kinase [Actinomyces procaprae]|uniref:sensor histidine kinase n=1 Tax=Actinomyces procaprae TaxID=2560010 RepID=UPI0014451C2C|nr:sensor histidine kinase [Actinomyces procaprae]
MDARTIWHTPSLPFVVDAGAAAVVIGLFWAPALGAPGRPAYWPLGVLLAALVAAAMLLRWRLPLAAPAAAFITTAVGWHLGLATDPMLAATWCLYPLAVRYGSRMRTFRLAAIIALILLVAVFGAPAADSMTHHLVASGLAVGVSWLLGCAESRRLAATSEATLQRAAALRARQQVAISREVHDVVGHALSVIRAEADVASRTSTTQDELRVSLTDIEERARAALEEVQQLVRTLRADDPARSTAPSLQELLTAARVSGLDVEAELNVPALTPELEAVVSRVVQEALSNVVRHSGASTCAVTVVPDDESLSVCIDDNGTGIPARLVPGAGLTGMRERVEAAGGSLAVSSLAQGGTRVLARIPLQEKP